MCFLDAWTHLLPSSGYGLLYSGKENDFSILRYSKFVSAGEEENRRTTEDQTACKLSFMTTS